LGAVSEARGASAAIPSQAQANKETLARVIVRKAMASRRWFPELSKRIIERHSTQAMRNFSTLRLLRRTRKELFRESRGALQKVRLRLNDLFIRLPNHIAFSYYQQWPSKLWKGTDR
jgi:hypothetical protein